MSSIIDLIDKADYTLFTNNASYVTAVESIQKLGRECFEIL
jgi:hypothetical protein